MKKLTQLLQLLKSPLFVVVELSLIITVVVACVIATGGYMLTGGFWGWFVLSLGLQFIIFAIIGTFLHRKDNIETAKLINKQLEAISKFVVTLSCAYCKQLTSTPININTENRFKCEYCGQENAVKMQFFTAQITTPLSKILLPGADEKEQIDVLRVN